MPDAEATTNCWWAVAVTEAAKQMEKIYWPEGNQKDCTSCACGSKKDM